MEKCSEEVCHFCPHLCLIKEGEVGFCAIRKNVGGQIVTLNYGHPIAAKVELMKNKAFYHYRPNERVLSIGLYGCNFRCPFCQNFLMTQPEALSSNLGKAYAQGGFGNAVTPTEIVAAMREKESDILCFCFTEPAVWQDYVIDCAEAVKSSQKKNVLLTNGFLSESAMKRLFPYMSAINIDFKGSPAFYKKYCKAYRDPVEQSIIEALADPAKDVEVTTLAIEGIHSIKEIYKLGERLFDLKVPVWQIRRFFPHYQFKDRAATSKSFLEKVAKKIQEIPIPYIYVNGKNIRS